MYLDKQRRTGWLARQLSIADTKRAPDIGDNFWSVRHLQPSAVRSVKNKYVDELSKHSDVSTETWAKW
jgi:hypothetical protein